ncbi:MAG: RnfABCDGE type electron transport complex subunit G [Oscillospiraceae bacterium]|nr:RnfABCDGE type electron transport complex subunit G [Oscillospiraceae bacterium]
MTESAKKPASMARLVIVLFVVTAVVALLLGMVDFITRDKIAANIKAKTDAAMSAVISADEYIQLDSFTDNSGLVKSVYEAKNSDGTFVGYVAEVSPSGFGGAINMVVGVDAYGNVSGISIVKMTETSGLGANASNTSFREQYIGKTGTLAVDKDGGEIVALTGATVTSRAVTDGVNAVLAAVNGGVA